MNPRYYILDDARRAVAVSDVLTWARWFEHAGDQRIVAQTHVSLTILVSTVFLGLDHSFCDGAPPQIFETMTFVDGHGDDCERYSTWDEALAGHAAVVARLTHTPSR